MASQNRRGGTMFLQVNGEVMETVGEFEVVPGTPKRTGVVGNEGAQGYIEEQQIARIEGKIRDRRDLRISDLARIDNATVTIRFAVGKTGLLGSAWFAGDAKTNTATGEIEVAFEGLTYEEI